VSSQVFREFKRPRSRSTVFEEMVEVLDAAAGAHDSIVVSAEGYQILFWDGTDRIYRALDRLARSHDVHVAYYVRPQHSLLEAAWRQWGFRHPHDPADYFANIQRRLNYDDTLARVRAGAPNASFEMRPFTHDLLCGNDVVTDFAKTFLGLGDIPPATTDPGLSNRGFPLEFAILLRNAPPGLLWTSIHDNKMLDRLKRYAVTWDIPERKETVEARRILQQHCHAVFEPGNQRIIRELGWNTKYFVPPGDDACELRDLTILNTLLTHDVEEPQRSLLWSALGDLVRTQPSGRRPTPL
jgi:hypothetical protein